MFILLNENNFEMGLYAQCDLWTWKICQGRVRTHRDHDFFLFLFLTFFYYGFVVCSLHFGFGQPWATISQGRKTFFGLNMWNHFCFWQYYIGVCCTSFIIQRRHHVKYLGACLSPEIGTETQFHFSLLQKPEDLHFP